MRPIEPLYEALFDGVTGQHFGGIYDPLLSSGELTKAHADIISTRPANRLVWRDDATCPDPAGALALVWMAPHVGGNPLAFSPGVLPFLVQALDAGASVQLHATTTDAIADICATVAPLLGGGHA